MLLILGAVWYMFFPPEGAWEVQFEAAFWRLGAMMSVIWLAYPEVKRLPGWLVGTIPLLVVVLAIKPKWFLIAVPIVVALAILKPKMPPRR